MKAIITSTASFYLLIVLAGILVGMLLIPIAFTLREWWERWRRL